MRSVLPPRGGAPRRGGVRPFAPVVIAFCVIAVGFFASTLYGEIHATQIDRAMEQMEANSIPSVEHLRATEAALRRVEIAAQDYAHAAVEGRPASLEPLRDARAEMGREVDLAEATPMYPGEREATDDANRTLAQLDATLARLGDIAAHDPISGEIYAEHDVRRAIDATDAAFDRVLAVNAENGHAEVARIGNVRRTSFQLALGLDVLCMLFAALAAFIAVRALRSRELAERAHQQLLEMRAEELEAFARRVAHDLLSPLSAVAFTLSAVRRNAERGKSIDEPLERAMSSLKRSQRLVHGVLDFARTAAPSQGDRAVLRETVDGVVEEVRAEEAVIRSGATIEVIVPDDEVFLACAPGILASIFSNLLRNAVKYLGDGDGEKRVTIRALVAEQNVRVEVEDTGPGLTPDLAAHVFEPYVRAPNNTRPGLGLGLATVRRFVDAHRGHVGVSSSPGRGSTFWFELPRVAVPPPKAPTAIPFGNGVTER